PLRSGDRQRDVVRALPDTQRAARRRDDYLRRSNPGRRNRLLLRGGRRRGRRNRLRRRRLCLRLECRLNRRRRDRRRGRRRIRDDDGSRNRRRTGGHGDRALRRLLPDLRRRGRRVRGRTSRRLWLRRRQEWRRAAETERLLRADVDRLEIRLGDVGAADDVRREQHDDVGLRDRLVVAREQLLQHGHANGARETLERLAFVFAEQARQQVRLAVAQAQLDVDFAVAERRDVDARDHHVLAARVVDDAQVEDDLVVE